MRSKKRKMAFEDAHINRSIQINIMKKRVMSQIKTFRIYNKNKILL